MVEIVLSRFLGKIKLSPNFGKIYIFWRWILSNHPFGFLLGGSLWDFILLNMGGWEMTRTFRSLAFGALFSQLAPRCNHEVLAVQRLGPCAPRRFRAKVLSQSGCSNRASRSKLALGKVLRRVRLYRSHTMETNLKWFAAFYRHNNILPRGPSLDE